MNKIKIVVVDDEIASRNMIKGFLEDTLEYEVVGDFAEGLDAVSWIRENKVDIILCDMNMPQINGVELIEIIQTIHEDIQFIAISSYDSFNYVRGCMIHSVVDYLLKHELSKERLLEVLEQIKTRCNIHPKQIEIKDRVGYCIQKNEDFSKEHIRQLVDSHTIDFALTYLVPIIISPDYNPEHGNISEYYKIDIVKMVLDIIGQILGAKYKYLVHITKEENIKLLLSFGDVKSYLYIVSTANNFCKKLSNRVNKLLDITTTIGIGSVCVHLDEAISQCDKMDYTLVDKLYQNGNRIFIIEDVKKITYSTYHIPAHIKRQLMCEVENFEDRSAINIIHDIFLEIEEAKCNIESVIAICEELIELLEWDESNQQNNNQEYKNQLMKFEVCSHFEEFIKEIYRKELSKAKEQNHKQFSPTIEKVIEFLQENYNKDITLEDCAIYVNSSYTHLSRIFKRETGKRFVEHLNMIRVNKAKALLIRGECSIKEIVELIGFRNYNYFFKVFKEIEGVTPNEFVEKAKKCSK